MIPIYEASAIREWDALTLQMQEIEEIELMERACEAFVKQFLLDHKDTWLPIWVICGIGNNGADGLGIARILHHKGFQVQVVIADQMGSQHSRCFEINLKRLPIAYESLQKGDELSFPNAPFILIDALLGSGLSRPIEGDLAGLVHQINSSAAHKIAVDIPSGLLSSEGNVSKPVAVQCNQTISFESSKPVFYNPDFAHILGNWVVVPIGLEKSAESRLSSTVFELTAEDAFALLPSRSRHAHKGTFGHVLLLAGSQGKLGAALLSAKAVLRAGVGKLTCYLPKGSARIMHVGLPEAMVSQSQSRKEIDAFFPHPWEGVVAIGPGIGTEKNAKKAVQKAILSAQKGLVIDADAINILSELNLDSLTFPANTVLTPHPAECDRLCGKSELFEERLKKVKAFCHRHQVVMVLKGGYSAVVDPSGKVYFCTKGNAGMATAGSGDVLTGIIAGLLSQGLHALPATQLGVFLHALSGDLAAEKLGQHSLIASDLIEFLPSAFLSVQNNNGEKTK